MPTEQQVCLSVYPYHVSSVHQLLGTSVTDTIIISLCSRSSIARVLPHSTSDCRVFFQNNEYSPPQPSRTSRPLQLSGLWDVVSATPEGAAWWGPECYPWRAAAAGCARRSLALRGSGTGSHPFGAVAKSKGPHIRSARSRDKSERRAPSAGRMRSGRRQLCASERWVEVMAAAIHHAPAWLCPDGVKRPSESPSANPFPHLLAPLLGKIRGVRFAFAAVVRLSWRWETAFIFAFCTGAHSDAYSHVWLADSHRIRCTEHRHVAVPAVNL